jgi:hypothetical protein
MFSADPAANAGLVGMQAFRLAFGIALLVLIIDTAAQIFRLVRSVLIGGPTPETLEA